MDDIRPFPAGVILPKAFSPPTPASLRAYVGACTEFLAAPLVSSLLECHPNDIAVHGPRAEWHIWWGWAARRRKLWSLLVLGWPCTDDTHPGTDIPPELTHMLNTVDTLALPRSRSAPSSDLPQLRGMSPKKSHEVSEMSVFIASWLSRSDCKVKHAVDVGAGQGYLSRALSEHPHSMDVLALDFSEVQTMGAERRGRNIKKKRAKPGIKKTNGIAVEDGVTCCADSSTAALPNSTMSQDGAGSVTHEMIHINPLTLQDSVTNWISSDRSLSQDAVPVLLVALHACGGLTPDVLRCYVTCRRIASSLPPRYKWYPAGLVVVGCCYNLMSPDSDFPLSTTVSKSPRCIQLSYNHRSLAAQSPAQWSLNASTRSAAELAIRKVVYRALLAKQTALMTADSTHAPERHGKVGRLHDSAYASLQTFISQFNTKTHAEIPVPDWNDVENLASCLAVLHVLRCRIGPVVESLVLVDRWLYLAENLPDDEVLSVNLFDQDQGSGRNVALVARPR